ncbi:aminotransferase class V-fold PLP-dependent enzyme [Yinghuangia sp. ASG 101]|uniref:aminotransferase class V-fold PLP-dependent enzyme n=1 Tax=Yinghuangia sp. ASG 101 TaxID=2896848 RepID=UPI001E44C0A2|nr:aminotransferase class V-fold PLP-dependent enzyme [Yinghuangia sp. ASG 101]UGQ13148.1 aminotransferase class V-fold PLP-dependent enzyme [Yinghuangia sp. ASG 101]
MDLESARKLWQPEPGWLNTATYGLPPTPAYEAVLAAQRDWRTGHTAWEGGDAETARADFAALVGADASDIAIGGNVSSLLAPVAVSLPPGTRVVLPDIEFTSNVFPWMVHEPRGVDVTAVPPAKLAASIDAHTDVVAYSLVQSADGTIADDTEIVAAARAHGAMVVVDGTQAVGWLPVDATRYDVLAVAGYKWLMNPRGTAYAYLAPGVRDRFVPVAAGWAAGEDVHTSYYGPPLRLAADARRFDISPAWFAWVGAAPALALVREIGVERIGAHNIALANRFLAGLGLPPGNSAIVTVDAPGADEALRAAGIRAAVRAGRLRASFHLYTTEADADAAVDALSAG